MKKILLGSLLIILCFTTKAQVYDIASGLTVSSIVVLPTNQINNDASADTMKDITGLSFPVVAGSYYWFRFFITYSASATATGSRWAINGPALTFTNYWTQNGVTGTTTGIRNNIIYDGGSVTSSSFSLTGNVAVIEGVINCSSSGTVIGRFSSEVSSSAITCQAFYSYVEYKKIH